MPITRRGSNAAKPFIADFYDRHDVRRQVPCASILDGRVVILRHGGRKSGKDLRETTVRELFEYVWSRRQEKKRPGRVATSRLQSEVHLLPILGDIQVRHVDKGHLARVLDGMKQVGLAQATIGYLVGYVVSCFDIAVARGCIRRNPARAAYAKVARSGTRDRPAKEPAPAVVAALEDAATGWVAVQLGLYTEAGLTPSEATGLAWDAVDLDAGTIRVSKRMTGEHVIVPLDGNRLPRTVSMTDKLVALIEGWRCDPACGTKMVLHPDGYLRAWTQTNRPLIDLQIELGFVADAWEISRGAPIDEPVAKHPHMDFRLVAAGRWHREGKSLKELAALLGYGSTRQLIPLVRGMNDVVDLDLIRAADAGLNQLLGNTAEEPL